MFHIKEYRKVKSLQEAWELNQKRINKIGAGTLWLRMRKNPVGTVIDLSDLGLDKIEETEDEIKIGCMVTLRQLEMNPMLDAYSNGAIKEALHHIIGVQFRNVATVGGSIFGRFGFSDVLTMFMAFDTYVELYKGGIVSLYQFATMPYDNDILVRLIVKKEKAVYAYRSVRTNASSDFPVLTLSGAVLSDSTLRLAVGARPARAMHIHCTGHYLVSDLNNPDTLNELCQQISEEAVCGSNLRGSAEYRTHLVKVMSKRLLHELSEKAKEV